MGVAIPIGMDTRIVPSVRPSAQPRFRTCEEARHAGFHDTPCCDICHDRFDVGNKSMFAKVVLGGRTYQVCCHVLKTLVTAAGESLQLAS